MVAWSATLILPFFVSFIGITKLGLLVVFCVVIIAICYFYLDHLEGNGISDIGRFI